MSATTRKTADKKRLPKSQAVTTTTQQKKARQSSPAQSSPADQLWENTVKPRLDLAHKEQVEDLAKELFVKLCKSSSGGEKSATDVTASFLKPLEENKNNNLKMAGAWKFEGGTLDILYNIKGGNLVSREVDIERFSLNLLKSTITSETLTYEGDVDQYGCCRDAFEAYIDLTYDPIADTIDGYVHVEPCHDLEDGPDDADGGSFPFTATRK
mmetsp:Transcript_18386/g.21250  ORF Transcript_18386/g.21250 Transcript_18386/m.21250 type:complete len:212 (-) Transcript_18386:80-715(-)